MLNSFNKLEGYHKAYLNKFYNQIKKKNYVDKKTLFTQYTFCVKSKLYYLTCESCI